MHFNNIMSAITIPKQINATHVSGSIFWNDYKYFNLSLGLKSYFPNEHIIVENIRRQSFQLAQSSWKLVLIIIIYHIFSIIVYHLVIYVYLFLLIFIVYVQVRFSESTILNESLDSSFTKNVHQ